MLIYVYNLFLNMLLLHKLFRSNDFPFEVIILRSTIYTHVGQLCDCYFNISLYYMICDVFDPSFDYILFNSLINFYSFVDFVRFMAL